MNLAQVADELYRLTPAEFIPARDEHARRAREAGDAGLAREIMKLRRPTVSAWLVNRLVQEAGDELGQLLELGESLREAQRTLAGERLRELSGQRRQLVGAIVQEAKRLAASAGQAISAQAEREVAATLEAALADPDAATAVRSGQLIRALSHVGLGDEDMGTVIAFPAAPQEKAARKKGEGRAAGSAGTARGPAGPARGRGQAARGTGQAERTAAQQRAERAAAAEARAREAAEQRRAREAEAAARDLREAHEIAQEARAALDEAEQRLAGVRDRRQTARQRADELERLLSEAEAEQTSLNRSVREAQRSRDVAAKWLDTAERRLARAQDRAAKHT